MKTIKTNPSNYDKKKVKETIEDNTANKHERSEIDKYRKELILCQILISELKQENENFKKSTISKEASILKSK